MRIDRLDLIRYGAFENRSLEFDPQSPVTIVYGPNEAGKSTALAALEDLLFDFPQRSPAAFRFKTSDLRLGGVVRNAGGEALHFHRRKGAKAVLRAPEDDSPLPDDALAPFLVEMSREAFRQIFALDAERLRDGGRQLLENGGELGETLLNASGAIANAEHRRAALAERAAELFNPARKAAKLPLYDAFGRYQEARKTFETTRVTAREAEAARAAVRETGARLEDMRSAKQAAEDAAALALRAQQAGPKTRARDAARQALEAYEDVADAPAGKGAALSQLRSAVEEAEQQVAEAEQDLAELNARRAATPAPGLIVQEEGAVDALTPLRALAEGALEGMPRLKAEHDQAEAQKLAISRRLGVDPDHIENRLISDAELAEVKRFLSDGRDLLARSDGALTLTPAIVEEAAALLKNLGDIGGLYERARAAREGKEASEGALAEKLAALPCFAGTAEELAGFAPPSEAEIERFDAQLAALESEHTNARERAKEREEESAGLMARVEAEVGAPPSEEEILRARSARDAEWRRIRSERFEGKKLDRPASPDLFEERLGAADGLADRRAAEAQRAERIAADRRRLAQIAAEQEEATRADLDRKGRCKALKEAWVAAWKGLPREPERPSAMKAWPAQRLAILAAARDLTAKASAQAGAEAALKSAMGAMDRLGALLEDPAPRPENAGEAVSVINRWRSHVEAAQQSVRLSARLADWRAGCGLWSERLALPKATGDRGWLEAAEAAAAAAAEAPRVLEELGRANARLREAEARIDAFRSAASDVAARLATGEMETGTPVKADVGQWLAMARHWSEALEMEKKRAAEHDRLTVQLEAAETQRARAVLARDRRRAALDQEASALGVASDGVDALVARLEARDAAASALAAAERDLLEVAGGRNLEEVEAAIAGRDDDALARAAAEAKAAAAEASSAHEAAVRADQAAQQAVQDLEADRGAARAARTMEAVAAEGAELSEEWLRLKASELMLGEAIRRYREKTSNPMMTRASKVFARLTEGSFERIDSHFDDKGEERIVGIRPSGERVEPAGMSEGARDQLFLSLRLAAIERWSETRTPAPFVGDDLLTSFDDDRALAAFKALAELGKTTQVLLFTHHRHMVDLGRAAIGEALSVIPLERSIG